MPTGNQKIEQKSLSIIEDQLNYEALAVKKYRQASQSCTNPDIVNLCNDASTRHKKHFDQILSYLNSHN